MSSEKQEVRMVFDAPPGRDMPTLVEIEDQSGRAIDIGEWRARPDGYGNSSFPSGKDRSQKPYCGFTAALRSSQRARALASA
jgi:hypothetical protein